MNNNKAKQTKRPNPARPPVRGGDEPKNNAGLMKRLKYGSVAVIFTAVFIAVIIIGNIVATAIHAQYPMYLDMTKEQIYGISDSTRELLSDITKPVEFIIQKPVDLYEREVSGGSMIIKCLKAYTSEYPNITIKVIDSIKDPNALAKYKTSDVSSISLTSVIIASGNDRRIITNAGFFATSSETGEAIAFVGEKVVTSSIVQVASGEDMPIVYFTEGHGESEPPGLMDLFAQEGYVAQKIDLNNTDIDPNAKIIVIFNPLKDFIGASGEDVSERSEVDKLASFLNNYGNVMYFTSADTGALPVLEELLFEYGFAFDHDAVLYDTKNSIAGYNGLALSTQYVYTNAVAEQLHKSIRDLPTLPKTIAYYAKPVVILSNVYSESISPVLNTYPTAYAIKNGEEQAAGESTVMGIAVRTRSEGETLKTSLLLVSGSAYFCATEFLTSPSYSNSDILLNAIRIMGNRKVTLDFDYKFFEVTSLDVMVETANNWTVACILLMPTLVSIAGLAVWLKRRHS